MRVAAEERRRGEEDDGAGVVVPPAEAIGEPAGEWQDDHVGHDVTGADPRDLFQRGAQASHHVRNGHVHDAGVHQLEDAGEHHREGNDIPIVEDLRPVPRCGPGGQGQRRHRQRVVMVTSTLMPGRSGWSAAAGLSTAIRTGTRCTTLVKLPVALSGGSSENLAESPGLTCSSWVSFRLAVTQTPLSGTTAISCWPTCTSSPGSTLRRATTPLAGAVITVYE